MGWNNITLKKRQKQEWEALKDNVLIYELKLPKFPTIQRLRGTQELWQRGNDTSRRGYYGSNKQKVYILQVTSCWRNPKNTILVVRAGEEYTAILSRSENIEGYVSIDVPRGYNNKKPDVFENIKIGTWLVCPEKYDGTCHEIELAFICNDPKMEDVKGILETGWRLHDTQHEHNEFRWNDEHELKSYGTVSIQDMQLQENIFNKALRSFKWVKRKNRWDLFNSVKANLNLKDDGTNLRVKVRALDGNAWGIIAPTENSVREKETYESLYKMDWWLPFLYRKPNDKFMQQPKAEQTNQLMGHFLQTLHKLPEADFTLTFGKKKVEIVRKVTGSNARLNYLDGKIVKADSMLEKLKDFFINDKPIVEELEAIPGEPVDTKPKTRVLSAEAQGLINDGLNGKMRDMEGEFPFHLNIIYKKEERKWYIECAGKLFYVKGGYGALKKVKSAVKGTAVIDHDKYGWDRGGRSGTRIVRDRIGELVGADNALWIVINVKKMGALMKAIGTQ